MNINHENIKNNALKAYLYKFCSMYHCTIEDIAKTAGTSKSNLHRMMKAQKMNIDSYFALCDALSKISNMYDSSYYLVRIKFALTKAREQGKAK